MAILGLEVRFLSKANRLESVLIMTFTKIPNGGLTAQKSGPAANSWPEAEI